jgi:CHASE1-domain containing sensor protein
MNNSNDTINQVSKRKWLPIAVFALMMVGTIVLSWFINQSAENERLNAFQEEVNLIESATINRSNIYINALRSGVGVFESSDEVTREEWASFVGSLNLQDNFPGIQGFGFAESIPATEKENHEAEIRDQGFPEYEIRPDGIREEYTSITLLEPFDERNKQAFGFDMFSEETRREAMRAARDTGEPSMSGRVTLVQEIDTDVQAGFLIYLPLYKKNAVIDTPEQRADALEGYVYAPFRAENFMTGLLRSDRESLVNFALFDGQVEDYSVNDLLFDSAEGEGDYNPDNPYYERREISIGGRIWTLIAVARPELTTTTAATSAPYVMFILGTLFSLIVSILLSFYANSRQRALAMAESMTDDLRKRTEESEKNEKDLANVNAQLEKRTNELSEKIKEVEKINEYMINREEKMVELKKELDTK